MQPIPVRAVDNQVLAISLNNQAVQLNIYQKLSGLYMDVLVNGVAIVSGVLCENLNRIVRDLYLGFIGDFVWLDNLGSTDPFYTGLGSRYTLMYLAQADLVAGQG